MALQVLLLSLALAGAALAQLQARGDIRGSVWSFEKPVARASVEARAEGTLHAATTDEDGAYTLLDLPPGKYDLTVSATGFWRAEIREVLVEADRAKLLPPVEIAVGLYGSDFRTRPAFFRESTAVRGRGAIGGTVVSDNGGPVTGAEVTLYMRGKGKLGSRKTATDGSFSFTDLDTRGQTYWIRITCAGYFSEELDDMTALRDLESVYPPIRMESCRPGRCQPHLKTIRVMPPGA